MLEMVNIEASRSKFNYKLDSEDRFHGSVGLG